MTNNPLNVPKDVCEDEEKFLNLLVEISEIADDTYNILEFWLDKESANKKHEVYNFHHNLKLRHGLLGTYRLKHRALEYKLYMHEKIDGNFGVYLVIRGEDVLSMRVRRGLKKPIFRKKYFERSVSPEYPLGKSFITEDLLSELKVLLEETKIIKSEAEMLKIRLDNQIKNVIAL